MDVHTIHSLLIILHAASGTISFFAGCLVIFRLSYLSNRRLFGLYWWTLVGLVLFLLGAMSVYWIQYSYVERIVFSGLFALGMYMLYRARSARRSLEIQQPDWKHAFIEHIGFTLISLFEGFIIVSGINAGLPGWLVAILVGCWINNARNSLLNLGEYGRVGYPSGKRDDACAAGSPRSLS